MEKLIPVNPDYFLAQKVTKLGKNWDLFVYWSSVPINHNYTNSNLHLCPGVYFQLPKIVHSLAISGLTNQNTVCQQRTSALDQRENSILISL